MKTKIDRFVKVYPWYSGFTSDLLFYIAIDTLFLTIVKNFSPSQIVSITSFSQLACIVLQFPILFIIKKIGNTASLRIGAIFLFLSSVFITVGNNYYIVLLGRILHDAAVIFRTASFVALENNLDLVDRRNDFVRLRTDANTVYAVVTMLISFVAGYMFNLNHYLPMIGCISTCAIGVILSFLMEDCSDYNKVSYKSKTGEKKKIHYSKFIVITLLAYAVFYLIVNNGQAEGKLFIQQHILLDFDVETTSLIISAMVCVSRIIRVFSNIVFGKLYYKYKSIMGLVLAFMLSASIGFMLFGSFITQVIVKIIIMSIGYTIILFVRDPFNLYTQDVLFDNTPKEQHQTLITMMQFGVKILMAGIGVAYSAILISYPMIVVISIVFAISIIEILIGVKLYRMVLVGKKQLQKQKTV